MKFINKVLVLFLSLTFHTSMSFVVTRLDEGDEFEWPGHSIVQCGEFSGKNSAYRSRFQKCHCNYGRSFSTEKKFSTMKCSEYRTGKRQLTMLTELGGYYLLHTLLAAAWVVWRSRGSGAAAHAPFPFSNGKGAAAPD